MSERRARILRKWSTTEARTIMLSLWSSMSLILGYDVIHPSIFGLDPEAMSIFPRNITSAMWVIAGLFGLGAVLVAHDAPKWALPVGFGVLVFMPALTTAACWALVFAGEDATPASLLFTCITGVVAISALVVWPPRVAGARRPWEREN